MNKQKKLNKTRQKKQSEKIQPISGRGKPNTKNQNKNCSKNNKKLLTNVAASGFGVLTKKYVHV